MLYNFLNTPRKIPNVVVYWYDEAKSLQTERGLLHNERSKKPGKITKKSSCKNLASHDLSKHSFSSPKQKKKKNRTFLLNHRNYVIYFIQLHTLHHEPTE